MLLICCRRKNMKSLLFMSCLKLLKVFMWSAQIFYIISFITAMISNVQRLYFLDVHAETILCDFYICVNMLSVRIKGAVLYWGCFTFPGLIFLHDRLTLCLPTMRDFAGINKLCTVWEIESILTCPTVNRSCQLSWQDRLHWGTRKLSHNYDSRPEEESDWDCWAAETVSEGACSPNGWWHYAFAN